MDMIIATLFGSIGAGILYLVKGRKTPFKKILAEQTFLSDLVGLGVIIIIGVSIYLMNNK